MTKLEKLEKLRLAWNGADALYRAAITKEVTAVDSLSVAREISSKARVRCSEAQAAYLEESREL